MRDSGVKCIFTCLPLLQTTVQVAQKLGMPNSRIYILELPKEFTEGQTSPKEFKTVNDLIALGKNGQRSRSEADSVFVLFERHFRFTSRFITRTWKNYC